MSTAKVLVVDDEMEFASTLSERLSLRGYDAKAVYCTEDAFAIARSDPPDVILLDMKMPGMSGAETCKIIKQFNPSILILLLTGDTGEEQMTEGICGDILGCVTKPIDINELTEKINKAKKQKDEQEGI